MVDHNSRSLVNKLPYCLFTTFCKFLFFSSLLKHYFTWILCETIQNTSQFTPFYNYMLENVGIVHICIHSDQWSWFLFAEGSNRFSWAQLFYCMIYKFSNYIHMFMHEPFYMPAGRVGASYPSCAYHFVYLYLWLCLLMNKSINKYVYK